MERTVKLKSLLAATFALMICVSAASAENDWQTKLEQELPLLGHRNWIVIADSAYPLQTSAGVETIETNSDMLQVVQTVLNELDRAPHVEPLVYTDRELQFLEDQDAPGVTAYRIDLKSALGDREVSSRLTLSLSIRWPRRERAFMS
jgi:hypothetical protein